LKRIGSRGGLAGLLLLIVAASAVAAPRLLRGHSQQQARSEAISSRDSDRVRFDFLRRQHSNRCGMPASALNAMAPGARLQGSCCFPMDFRSYLNQVRDLKRYAAVALIPKDPYDITAGLAQQLLRYDSHVALSRGQQRQYERAMSMSAEKGPCCCQCWRWNAFRGLSKFLIAHDRWQPRQLAALIGMLDGCGGSSGGPSPMASMGRIT